MSRKAKPQFPKKRARNIHQKNTLQHFRTKFISNRIKKLAHEEIRKFPKFPKNIQIPCRNVAKLFKNLMSKNWNSGYKKK